MSTQNETQFEVFEVEERNQTQTATDEEKRAYKRWTVEENMQYINFLKSEKAMFSQEKTRRSNRVFKLLSEHIKTKTQSQCKSHHQKMFKQHKNIEKMMLSVIKRAKKQGKSIVFENECESTPTQPRSFFSDIEIEEYIQKNKTRQPEDIFDVLIGSDQE